MKYASPQRFPLAQFMSDKEPLWKTLVKKYDLLDYSFQEAAHGRLEKRSSTSNTRNANGLDFLPLYSSDLNQIASVWKLTRQLCLHNVYFPKLDQLCELLNKQRQRKPPLFVACCENINIYGEDVGSRSKC
jgi:hypothetical protein